MDVGVQGEEGRRVPGARAGESTEMPLTEIPVGQIHRYTFLASADQLWFKSPGKASLHRHLEVVPSSSRSSSLNHVILLGPAYQFTTTLIRGT